MIEKFYFAFKSFSTAKFVKNSHLWARIYFPFPKIVLKQIWNSFSTNFVPERKDWKSSYLVRQNLTLLCNLILLILGQKCVKGLRVINFVTKITIIIKLKVTKIWSILEPVRIKQRIPETFIHEIFETNTSFHVKEQLQEIGFFQEEL